MARTFRAPTRPRAATSPPSATRPTTSGRGPRSSGRPGSAWAGRSGFLDVAADAAAAILTGDRTSVAVNTDLHFDQVLRHPDGAWCVVDPILRRGDAERTAVNVLWHRVDEMADREIPTWFGVLVEAAELDPDLARAWALWRITDYMVWGLEHGLTEDPPRCARLLRGLA